LAGLEFLQPEWLRQQLREWNDLPHRQDNFEGLVCRCLLASEGLLRCGVCRATRPRLATAEGRSI
jgi:hypothetical protein